MERISEIASQIVWVQQAVEEKALKDLIIFVEDRGYDIHDINIQVQREYSMVEGDRLIKTYFLKGKPLLKIFNSIIVEDNKVKPVTNVLKLNEFAEE